MLKEIVSNIKFFFKQLFCNHYYYYQGQIDCTYLWEDGDEVSHCPVSFFECRRCGKRIVIRRPKWYYNNTLLETTELWRKGQLDINFSSFPKDEGEKKECI